MFPSCIVWTFVVVQFRTVGRELGRPAGDHAHQLKLCGLLEAPMMGGGIQGSEIIVKTLSGNGFFVQKAAFRALVY